MFDQELYENESAELATEPGDLFHNYEIEGWDLNPRIYKIVAVSAVLNIIAFFTLGQPQLFTRGACESPFVGRVCSVLDTVYVGSILFGTERDYVDKEYEKTELSDADIVWIDQTGVEPQFTYPAGYFYKDPAQMAAEQNPFGTSGFLAPGIPSTPNNSSLINTPQILPKSNPDAVKGSEPDSPFSIGDDNSSPTIPGAVNRKGRRGGRPIDPANANTNTVANANTNPATNANTTPSGPTEPGEINSRPFADLALKVNELRAKQQLDLQAQFQVAATAKLSKDGKIASFKFTKAQSTDPEMVTIVKNAVEAFNDSNMLQYLTPISGEKLDFSIQQDQTAVAASIQSELKSDTRAQSMVGILKLAIDLVIERKKKTIETLETELAAGNDPDHDKAQRLQNSKDDLELLTNTKVLNDGKLLKISFGVPKEILQQMIQRKLDEQAAQTKKAGNPALNQSNASASNSVNP
jgi:hypothetical protein